MEVHLRTLGCIGLLCLFPAFANAQEQKQETPKQDKNVLEDTLGFPVHGFFSSRYWGRWGGGDQDHEFYQYLGLDFGDPEKNKVTAHLFARALEDINSNRSSPEFHVFDSIYGDAERHYDIRLYEGYFDLHRMGPTEDIRVGRQYLSDAPGLVPFLSFDGVRVVTKECTSFHSVQFGFYGGTPVHPFMSSVDNNSLWGAFLQGKPWEGGQGRLDWLHVNEDTFFGRQQNDLLGVSGWQNLGKYLRFFGSYTRLEDTDKDVLFRGTFYNPDWDLQIQASYYELLHAQTDYAIELDSFFFSNLFEYFPYWEARFLISKGFGKNFTVESGIDVRELNDKEEEGQFNHEFRHFYLISSTLDWPVKGMKISVSGDVWDNLGTDNGDTMNVGVDVSQRCTEKLKASIGTSYALYQYNFFLNYEQDRVRTYYAKLNYAWSKNVRFDIGYEFENGSFEDIHMLKVGIRYSF